MRRAAGVVVVVFGLCALVACSGGATSGSSQVLDADTRLSTLVDVDTAAAVVQRYLQAVVARDEPAARQDVCLCMNESAVDSLAYGSTFGGRDPLPISEPVTFLSECRIGDCGPWPSAPLGVPWTNENPSRALLFATGNTAGRDPHVVVFAVETDHGPKVIGSTWGFNYHDFPVGESDMYCRDYLTLGPPNREIAIRNVFVWGIPREVTDSEVAGYLPKVNAGCAADSSARIQVILRELVFR